MEDPSTHTPSEIALKQQEMITIDDNKKILPSYTEAPVFGHQKGILQNKGTQNTNQTQTQNPNPIHNRSQQMKGTCYNVLLDQFKQHCRIALSKDEEKLFYSHIQHILRIYQMKRLEEETMENRNIPQGKNIFIKPCISVFMNQYETFINKQIDKHVNENERKISKKPIKEVLTVVADITGRKYSHSYLCKMMKQLDMSNCKDLEELDKDFCQLLCGLEELSLSGNMLKEIRYLPENLRILDLSGNRIQQIKLKRLPKTLIHIGLSYNDISDLSFFKRQSKNLISLDLSYNRIMDIEDFISSLKHYDSLGILQLKGNPCCILENYRNYVLKELSQLACLDDQDISDRGIDTDSTDRGIDTDSTNRGIDNADNVPPETKPTISKNNQICPQNPLYFHLSIKNIEGIVVRGEPIENEISKGKKKPPAKKKDVPIVYKHRYYYEIKYIWNGKQTETKQFMEDEKIAVDWIQIHESAYNKELISFLNDPFMLDVYLIEKDVPEIETDEETEKNVTSKFIGRAYVDLSSIFSNENVVSFSCVEVKDITKLDEPQVDQITISGELSIHYDKPAANDEPE